MNETISNDIALERRQLRQAIQQWVLALSPSLTGSSCDVEVAVTTGAPPDGTPLKPFDAKDDAIGGVIAEEELYRENCVLR